MRLVIDVVLGVYAGSVLFLVVLFGRTLLQERGHALPERLEWTASHHAEAGGSGVEHAGPTRLDAESVSR